MTISTTVTRHCQVVTETISTVQTASIGIWLKNGVRYEKSSQHGFAHFMEHLAFKKTRRHSSHELSSRFEIMGGHINAETGRELTAFHGQVPSFYAGELLELFIEMLSETDFSEQDFIIERDVVLQELAMLNDDPEEALEDFASQQVFGAHRFGQQILGSKQSLGQATWQSMHDYIKQMVTSDNICIVGVGNVDHDQLCKIAETLGAPSNKTPDSGSTPDFLTLENKLEIQAEQRHMQWLMPAIAYNDPDYARHDIANHILAGGYDSRLYQTLREKLGLVYSINSRIDSYSDTGLWFVQTNTEKENHQQLIDAVNICIEQLITDGPTDNEMTFAKQHLQSSLILEQDDLGEKMERYARDTFYLGRISSIEEQLQQYEKITSADVQALLKQQWTKASFFTAGY